MSRSDWSSERVTVVDANVTFSALMADGATRRLMLNVDCPLAAPEPTYEEIAEHHSLIQEKAGLNPEAVDELLERLFEHVNLVPESELAPYVPDAKEIIHHHDPDDVVYVAAALAVDGVIWSDDTDFHRPDVREEIVAFRTEDVVEQTDILVE